MTPEQIGPYQIERELGSGGMGTVYFGRHAESGRVAAVKVLPPSMSREPGFVARFNREIAALQAVHSPYIVELYDSGVDGETYYYAMEFVDGETLTDRLEREKRLPWRQVIDISVDVCRALKSAHNAGVIHRDLKPSNLMLTASGQVKLTDFGVAQIFAGGKLTATGGVIGTAEYMSPEQAEGKRATKQSDIYALGAVMYAMLTGRPPFVGKAVLELVQKHRFGQFDSPRRFVPEIPHWLDEVVCKCLSKNPDDRYPDAYVLSLRLAEIPRKVDLASAVHALGSERADSTAETIASEAARVADGGRGQGAGTFVRDAVRAELDRSTSRSMIEHWLDNTWVLLALLALVVTAGLWFYQRRAPDPESQFARGEELMQESRRESWISADDLYFRPLLERDRAAWESRIAPYRNRIELARKEQEILRQARRQSDQPPPATETLRVLDRVMQDVAARNVTAARLRLEALRRILPEDDAKSECAVIDRLLQDLPASTGGADEALLEAALRRAANLAEQGDTPAARRIWASILLLYRDDPGATEQVRRAESALHSTTSAP